MTAFTERSFRSLEATLSGQDARDCKFLSDHTKRVSRALRALRDENVVRSSVAAPAAASLAL